MSDFMPSGEAGFLQFAEVFTDATEEMAELLGIPAAAVTGIKTEFAAYKAAYTACEQPNAGRVDREDRAEKKAALSATIRRIKNAYIDGDPLGVVTDEIRMKFGLPPRDSSRTNVEPPSEIPDFKMKNHGYLGVTVSHGPRPPRCNGGVLFYCVSDEPITDHKGLTSTKLLTRMNETLTFGDSDRLKSLYAAMCWQNEKGELGPPSPIQSITII
jgi:hypothetical protein